MYFAVILWACRIHLCRHRLISHPVTLHSFPGFLWYWCIKLVVKLSLLQGCKEPTKKPWNVGGPMLTSKRKHSYLPMTTSSLTHRLKVLLSAQIARISAPGWSSSRSALSKLASNLGLGCFRAQLRHTESNGEVVRMTRENVRSPVTVSLCFREFSVMKESFELEGSYWRGSEHLI